MEFQEPHRIRSQTGSGKSQRTRRRHTSTATDAQTRVINTLAIKALGLPRRNDAIRGWCIALHVTQGMGIR